MVCEEGGFPRTATMSVPEESDPTPGGDDDLVDVSLRLRRELIGHAILDARVARKGKQAHRLAIARIILETRSRRRAVFPGVRFGEASWDMILDLYIADQTGQQVDVSGLCIASNAPTTTALRHIETLVDRGYVIRQGDQNDGRRTFLLAADRLRVAVERWLDMHIAAVEDERAT